MPERPSRPGRRGPAGHESASGRRGRMAREAAGDVPRAAGARRRVLSQNHLRDPGAADRYVAAVGRPELPGLEVGAGEGFLTGRLLEVLPRLTAVELDPVHVDRLRSRFRDQDRLTVLDRDFLTMPAPDEDFVLVGNIPFATTSKIVSWGLAAAHLRQATLITQAEYARKQSGAYGRWTLSTVRTWPEWEWSLGPRIDSRSFHPRPRVDAAVLRIERRARPLVPAERIAEWQETVEIGFRGVGGSLATSLATRYPRSAVTAACDRADVPSDLAVGFVSPAQWLSIFADLDGAPRRTDRDGRRPRPSHRSSGRQRPGRDGRGRERP